MGELVKKAGRPRIKLTSEQIDQIEILAISLTTEQIADYFGISRKTFFRMMDRDPSIKALYKKGQAKALNIIGNKVFKWANEGDRISAMFYLKTRGGWRETQGIAHSHDDDSSKTDKSVKVIYVDP